MKTEAEQIRNMLKSEYSKEAVMGKSTFADCFLFDMAQGGRIVAARAPAASLSLGESFLDRWTEAEREEIRRYLFSYETRPRLWDSASGPVFLIPTLMPSATLGVAFVPRIDGKTLLRLTEREGCGWMERDPRLAAEACGRLSAKMATHAQAYADFGRELRACFETSLSMSHALPRRIDGPMQRSMLALSTLVGCPLESEVLPRLDDYGDFDWNAWLAFCLVSLLLARRIGLDREARIGAEESSNGVNVWVRLLMSTSTEKMPQELLWIESFAERRRMRFEYAVMRGQLLLRFAPLSKDWSYLELKQDRQFDWER